MSNISCIGYHQAVRRATGFLSRTFAVFPDAQRSPVRAGTVNSPLPSTPYSPRFCVFSCNDTEAVMQKNILKIRALLILCLLAAFPPLSTDMYLPALPLLAASWGSTPTIINLTLVGFFISFSMALLVYGPLSDRYGRKPVLLGGISLYILACLGCALADSPIALIVGRVVQGLGAASAATLSLAMTKDYFDGAERVQAMAKMAIIISLAPMLAPVLGGLLMHVVDWSAIFYAQAGMGCLAIWGVRQLTEPVAGSDRSLRDVLQSYGRLMVNRRFIGLCFLIALGMTPLFCYIGGSSFISSHISA